ncbi:MAG TPA: glycosyltransferase, partial [Phormidium sp.]
MHPVALAKTSIWNGEVYRRLQLFLRQEKPNIAHFHNTLPLISPSAYYAAKSEGVPVVQTLHNYRLLCPNALFFRNGQVCEDCLGTRTRWPSVVHQCYRSNRLASATVATMLSVHQAFNTWSDRVDLYIALTEFARRKFIEGGLPKEKIVVKPNFVAHDSGPGSGSGGYGLFVGRLSVEKGLDVLIKAWELLNISIPLKIVGDGPLKNLVIEASQKNAAIEWLGRKSPNEVYSLMGEASFVVIPSKWYETFGRVAIEAFAKGTPVIASKIGALEEIVDYERTGLHFKPSSPEDLAEKVEKAFSSPKSFSDMRHE